MESVILLVGYFLFLGVLGYTLYSFFSNMNVEPPKKLAKVKAVRKKQPVKRKK